MIKKFEEFSINESKRYPKEVSKEEYREKWKIHNHVNFSEEEKVRMDDILQKKSLRHESTIVDNNHIIIYVHIGDIFIDKLSDNWFAICFEGNQGYSYYICDEFEELEEFLNSKIPNSKRTKKDLKINEDINNPLREVVIRLEDLVCDQYLNTIYPKFRTDLKRINARSPDYKASAYYQIFSSSLLLYIERITTQYKCKYYCVEIKGIDTRNGLVCDWIHECPAQFIRNDVFIHLVGSGYDMLRLNIHYGKDNENDMSSVYIVPSWYVEVENEIKESKEYSKLKSSELIVSDLHSKRDSFTPKEFNLVKEIFNSHIVVTKEYKNNNCIEIKPSKKDECSFETCGIKRILVHKYMDEWYIVTVIYVSSYYSCFYKCDQLNGLKECLEDILESINGTTVNESKEYSEIQNIAPMDKRTYFTNKEFDFIDKIFYTSNVSMYQGHINFGYNYIYIKPLNEYKIYQIILYKYMDEWYNVTINSYQKTVHYKCDQFSGLKKCLEDNVKSFIIY